MIGGLSMGGYGAIKLALKCPQLFCTPSHSAALDVRRRLERPEVSAEMRRIFGPAPGGGPNDPYALAEKIDRALLALRLDCGRGMVSWRKTAPSIATLRSSASRTNTPSSPAHTWEYWDCHIQKAIAFHQRVLGSATERVKG